MLVTIKIKEGKDLGRRIKRKPKKGGIFVWGCRKKAWGAFKTQGRVFCPIPSRIEGPKRHGHAF